MQKWSTAKMLNVQFITIESVTPSCERNDNLHYLTFIILIIISLYCKKIHNQVKEGATCPH